MIAKIVLIAWTIATMLSVVLAGSGVGEAQNTQSTIGPRWSTKSDDLWKYSWLYAKSIPPEARYQLLPLYQETDRLLQELYAISPSVAIEIVSNLIPDVSDRTPQPANAPARRQDATSGAQDEGELFWATRSAAIQDRLTDLDKQIHDLRIKYGIETISPAPRSRWSVLFERPKLLTADQVKGLLAPAAREAAKPAGRALTGQDYERERRTHYEAVKAATDAFDICVHKHQACVHSCDASRDPFRCYQQCGECKDTAILKAQQELDDFDRANNYGSPKGNP